MGELLFSQEKSSGKISKVSALSLSSKKVVSSLKKLNAKSWKTRREGYLALLGLGKQVEKALLSPLVMKEKTIEAKRLLRNLRKLIAYSVPVSLEPGLSAMILRFNGEKKIRRGELTGLISKMCKKHGIPVLIQIMKRDKDYYVRHIAAEELLKLGSFAGAEYIFGVDNVIKGLKAEEIKKNYEKALNLFGEEKYLSSIYYFKKALAELEKIKGRHELKTNAYYNMACAHGLYARELMKKLKTEEKRLEREKSEAAKIIVQAKIDTLKKQTLGQKKKALIVLEDAINAGFDDYEHIENDGDLEVIRQEKRYKQLIKKLKQIAKETHVD